MVKLKQISVLFLIFISGNCFSQDSLLVKMASDNQKSFTFSDNKFSGEGWDFIMNEVNKSTNLLIGEDHFSNEIPAFIGAITDEVKFDNFYIEVDPYVTGILEKSIQDMEPEKRKVFNEKYQQVFSFYALKPEYALLEKMVNSGVNILGSDQIVMYAEQIIFNDILQSNPGAEARKIYEYVIEQSEASLEKFFEDPNTPFYFMTPDFSEQLDKLDALTLSDREKVIVRDMKKSAEIYQKRSHSIRVKLIIRQVMDEYETWKDKKNLFKYGANHVMRGESLLTVYDIGNVVANIIESQENKSFHVMIVGESGEVGSPFKGFPPTKINKDKGFYLSFLSPFFPLTDDTQWDVFDLRPIRKSLNRNKLKIENKKLERVIKGFDVLVIIPEVSAAEF